MCLPFSPAILLLRFDSNHKHTWSYKDVCLSPGLEDSRNENTMKWKEKFLEKHVYNDSICCLKRKKYRVYNYIHTSKGMEGHNQTINTGYSTLQNWMRRKRDDYIYPSMLLNIRAYIISVFKIWKTYSFKCTKRLFPVS